MNRQSAVVLLSGGLDSTVSMVVSIKKYSIKLALFFDYGQRSVKKESEAVEKICRYYEIPYKIIKLDWLKEITATSLVNQEQVLPEYTVENLNSNVNVLKNSARAVWVPNRNGVMLNIGAAIAESMGCGVIIFGANKEEATTFPDNSADFTEKITEVFSYSTSNGIKVEVPLVNKDKTEIVSSAIENNLPFNFVWSCYSGGNKHCGKCESCARLKRALVNNNRPDLLEEMSLNAV